MEEARRRMSLLGEGDLPLPDLSNPSTIFSEDHIKRVTVLTLERVWDGLREKSEKHCKKMSWRGGLKD